MAVSLGIMLRFDQAPAVVAPPPLQQPVIDVQPITDPSPKISASDMTRNFDTRPRSSAFAMAHVVASYNHKAETQRHAMPSGSKLDLYA